MAPAHVTRSNRYQAKPSMGQVGRYGMFFHSLVSAGELFNWNVSGTPVPAVREALLSKRNSPRKNMNGKHIPFFNPSLGCSNRAHSHKV